MPDSDEGLRFVILSPSAARSVISGRSRSEGSLVWVRTRCWAKRRMTVR